MNTTTYNFQPIWAYGEASLTCSDCGKVRKKAIRQYATQNPFNKNDRGEVCSLEEVREQARLSVQREVDRQEAHDFTCSKCIRDAAPAYEHVNLTQEQLDAAIAFCSEREEMITSLIAEMRDHITENLVGRDVTVNDRLAVIREGWCDKEALLLTNPYSRARYAKPGQVLEDRQGYRLKNLKIVEGNDHD